MEERAVLEVLEAVVQLVLPDDAARAREVDHLHEQRVARLVRDERERALEAGIRPLVRLRVGVVDPREGRSMDLVRVRGYRGLDLGLLVARERRLRRHVDAGWMGEVWKEVEVGEEVSTLCRSARLQP